MIIRNTGTSKKKILFIVGCVFVLSIILREIGIFDFNFYSFQMSSTQSSQKNQTNMGKKKGFSYHLVVKYKSETILNYTHLYTGTHPPIEIKANLAEPVYSGNYALPFVKNFQITYQCNFASVKSSQNQTIKGKVEGTVTARIRGFCSRIKAKELAMNEAKKRIKSYFQTQLIH
ncbi:MAG: hypothetical protein WCS27_09090 [Victivallaceae bacterium]